jgi:hypothetical protein
MQSDSVLEKAVTVDECAPLVESGTSVLYRMIKLGLIPCLRTGISGRGIRVLPSEVRAALKARPAWVDPAPHKRGKKKNGTAV